MVRIGADWSRRAAESLDVLRILDKCEHAEVFERLLAVRSLQKVKYRR